MNDISLLILLHNELRTKTNIQPLILDKVLTRYATQHTKWMAKNNILQHSKINFIQENIAWGQPDPKSVMVTWLRNKRNKANILNSEYGKIGCYIEPDSCGKLYWCVMFSS